MILLRNNEFKVELCHPGEYYQGTRFDRAGVFRLIKKGSYSFADEWFPKPDPLRHDNVCGLSEEFVTVDFTDVPPGEVFCKVGVGLLRRPDDAPYDRFRLYEVANPGRWEVEETSAQEVCYRHRISGWYTYTKTITLRSKCRLEIAHSLDWENGRPLKGYCYNHHFLTFGDREVGPDRHILFPFKPSGDWRELYDNVRFVGNGVRFLGPVDAAKAVFCGNIHNEDGPTPYSFNISDGLRSVEVSGDRLLNHIVLWSNNRVACVEPYMPLQLAPGAFAAWTLRYHFD